MDANYMLACGIVWRKDADPEAGWELVEGLQSTDPQVRVLAHALLLENGAESMHLLESALSSGAVTPEVAGPCMVEILRSEHARKAGKLPPRPKMFDTSLC